MVKGKPGTPVLLLCSDDALRDSLADLLECDGRVVTSDPQVVGEHGAMVIAACDAWPAGWSLARLRATCRRVPCLVLSGSPLAGDYAVADLQRGYFIQLPTSPHELLDLVAEMCRG